MAVAKGVNIEGLDPAARRELQILIAKARDAGIPITVTSGHRSREEQARLYARYKAGDPMIPLAAPPGSSRHEKGLSVDISVPKQHRAKFNELAKQHGFHWFGPRDAVHYDYDPGRAAAKPKADPYAAFRKPAAAQGDPYAAFRQAAQATAATDPYAAFRQTPAGLMGELAGTLRPMGMPARMTLDQAAAAAAALPNVPDPRSAAAGFAWLGRQAGRPVGAATAAANEMMRRAAAARAAGERATVPLGPVALDVDIPGALSDIAAGVRAGARAFRQAEQPPATFAREALGMLEPAPAGTPAEARQPKPGLNPTLYGLVTAGEQLLPLAYDPLNVIAPPVTKAAAALAKRPVAAVKRMPLFAAQERGRQIVDEVIQPTLRHKEDLQKTLRTMNAELDAARRASPALDRAVKGTGQNPVYDLATEYAKTKDLAGTQALFTRAQAQGVPVKSVVQIGDQLARHADETYAALKDSRHAAGKLSREEFLDAFMAIGEDGMPAGMAWMRQANRRELLRKLALVASEKPGAGLVQVPKTLSDEGVPLYGAVAGKYLPKEALAKLKEVVETVEPTSVQRVVRKVKNLYLAQPFTPVKNLIQNTSGIGLMMRKYGGDTLEAAAQAPAAGREVFQFLRTGNLSADIKALSDIDPSFLQALKSVKIADGTAGQYVRVGGKTIRLPTAPEAAQALFGKEGKLNPLADHHVFIEANSAVDLFAKLVGFKALRARGVPAEEAVKQAGKHIVTLGQLPANVAPWVGWIDRQGVMLFANVPAQLARQTLETAIQRPDLLMRPGQIQDRMLKAFGMEEAYKRDVPKDRKSPFVVPDPTRPGKFLDYTQLTPFGATYEIARAALEGGPPTREGQIRGVLDSSIYGTGLRIHEQLARRGPAPIGLKDLPAVAGEVAEPFLPMARAVREGVAAAQRRPVSRDPFAPAETLASFSARKLGLPTVKTGTRVEQREKGAALVERRLEVTGAAWDQELAAAERLGRNNPYRRKAEQLTAEKAALAARDAGKYVKGMLRETGLVDGKGQLTAEGRRKIRSAAQWLAALSDRVGREP